MVGPYQFVRQHEYAFRAGLLTAAVFLLAAIVPAADPQPGDTAAVAGKPLSTMEAKTDAIDE
ncbi:MAG: hypothetical protein GVY16_11815, partial [Planctomycetes bacterium]|nr:hypothetical protein [Planctomycetota bacterium]